MQPSGEPQRPFPAAVVLWRHLFGDMRGFLCLLYGRRAGSRLVAVHERYYQWPDEQWRAWRQARAADQAHYEVYFCVHLLAERRRRKASALSINALWCEVDHPLGPEWPDALPLPTAQVESSPGRWHLYWRLAHPVAPPRGESLNRSLARALGADRSGCDLTQVLRVPGCRNFKYDPPPHVTLQRLEPEASIDPDTIAPSGTVLVDAQPHAAAPLPERITAGSRNVWLTSLAGSLRRRGLDEEEMLVLLRFVNQRRCLPPLDDDELVRIAKSIARYPAGSLAAPYVAVEVL